MAPGWLQTFNGRAGGTRWVTGRIRVQRSCVKAHSLFLIGDIVNEISERVRVRQRISRVCVRVRHLVPGSPEGLSNRIGGLIDQVTTICLAVCEVHRVGSL